MSLSTNPDFVVFETNDLIVFHNGFDEVFVQVKAGEEQAYLRVTPQPRSVTPLVVTAQGGLLTPVLAGNCPAIGLRVSR